MVRGIEWQLTIAQTINVLPEGVNNANSLTFLEKEISSELKGAVYVHGPGNARTFPSKMKSTRR